MIANEKTELTELKSVLEDVGRDCLNNLNSEELKYMDQALEAQRDLSNKRLQEDAAAMEAVLELQSQVSEKEMSLSQMVNGDESTCQELDLATDSIQQAEANHAQLSREVSELQQHHKLMSEQKENLDTQRRAVEHQTTKAVPGIRHEVELYSYLTGTRWQYDSPATEVKGYITSQSGLKTFSLDSSKQSRFFIANYLWDQMEINW